MAIILVLLFHFEGLLGFGYIGVDLFFVISGYLVSEPFLKDLKNNRKVDWRTFFIKRITKILPSYYFFLFGGLIVARLLLIPEYADEVVAISDLPKYIFFYMSYDLTHVWSFEMAWSLCVEEHFYIFLTLIFVVITYLSFIKKKQKLFYSLLLLFILFSTLCKVIGYEYGLEVVIASHARIDALFL
ncbi:MAG: acyltransferase [Crocinitomicaceae bacterium]|nr:acyltransferase [Crocinitomicaceae bacterium]